ncbi:MAG: bifunctional 3,4-dihydroxy-2-butanone-4-phosphate synthase/GTP cyclohydrolase II, partial [Rhodopirellula sp. JB053]
MANASHIQCLIALTLAIVVRILHAPPHTAMSSSIELNTIPEAVEAIARGEVIIVIDAEDRENEG